MTSHEELRAKAEATYNAAADSFDAPANVFWDRSCANVFAPATLDHRR